MPTADVIAFPYPSSPSTQDPQARAPCSAARGRGLFFCLLALGLWLGLSLGLSARAEAAPGDDRYALLIGSNHGHAGEPALRYAVTDAQKMAEVLMGLGGFLPENVVVLTEPSADRVREALVRLNARIRTERYGKPGGLLVVYYSGHADALSLHLGATSLPWDELRNVTIGSAATTRLLLVDACRSGQATRVKGTRRDQPFALPTSDTTMPEGFAILSSATAGEDAQESDELRGSFFTHHLIAALRGVADRNKDGRITLSEAYQYATERTLASTAGTVSGIQHPTYHYELKGKADLVLTRLRGVQGHAAVHLPGPGRYLLWQGGQDGPLALEALVGREGRTVWLQPGTYAVQQRRPDRFFEGTVRVARNEVVDLRAVEMRAFELDQLVRKGGSVNGRAYSYAAALWGGAGSTPLPGLPPAWEAGLTLSADTASLSLDAHLGLAQSALEREALSTRLSAVSLTAGARKVFDLRALSLSAGMRAGATYFDQRYRSDRIAPARWQIDPVLDSILRADVHVGQGVFLGIEASVRVLYLRQREGFDGEDSRFPVLGRVLVGAGTRW